MRAREYREVLVERVGRSWWPLTFADVAMEMRAAGWARSNRTLSRHLAAAVDAGQLSSHGPSGGRIYGGPGAVLDDDTRDLLMEQRGQRRAA